MNTDTEALKALVALARKLPKLPFAERDGVQNADFAMATVKALPALERMLASQTQDRMLRKHLQESDHLAYLIDMMDAEKRYDRIPELCKELRKLLGESLRGELAAAPVASQMGEPICNCDGSPNAHQSGCLYAAPAAGMDADSAPPLAESVGDIVSIATELMDLCDRNHVVQEELPIRNRLREALSQYRRHMQQGK